MDPNDDTEKKDNIPPEMEHWLGNVDEITSKIMDLTDGKISPYEVDDWYDKRNLTKEIKEREEKEKAEKEIRFGKSGYGEKENGYKWWCKGCFTEFFCDLDDNKCTRCGTALMAQKDRRAALMTKLDDFKKEKVQRQFRRDKWTRWKKSQRLLSKSKNVDYNKWEYWEPNRDEEELDPIVPKDDPQFKAMEIDMQERKKKMENKQITANLCKERGNDCLKKGDYVGAIEHYNDGLEYRKDTKPLWTNKALAELKIGKFEDAKASAGKVVEYCEIFEEGFKKTPDLAYKAFLRRAQAYRGMHNWNAAVEDLREAVKIFPNERDARSLLEQTEEAVRQDRAMQEAARIADEAVKSAKNEPAAKSPKGAVDLNALDDDDDDDDAEEAAAAPADTAAAAEPPAPAAPQPAEATQPAAQKPASDEP